MAVGDGALAFNDFFGDGIANFNNAVGAFALVNNTDGFGNNAVGNSALFNNQNAAENTALGDVALAFNDADGPGLPTTTRQLAVRRSLITLMAVRTQSWVQGQDKT